MRCRARGVGAAIMTVVQQLTELAAVWLLALSTWVGGLTANVESSMPLSAVAGARPAPVMLAWAQDGGDTPIEPTSEEDVETLDEGVPAADQETLDEGAQNAAAVDPAEEEDIELLDQGAPPVVTPVIVEPLPPASEPAALVEMVPLAAADQPAATASAPTGPTVPPGFGSGRVHVSAGSRGFPAGLDSCQVGAVTGRAYVGIGCGDGLDSAVGHAPSFEAFPFVVDPGFPFDASTELPVAASESLDDSPGDLFVNNATLAPSELVIQGDSAPEVTTDGSAFVTLAQEVRDRSTRVSADRDTDRSQKANKDGDSRTRNQRNSDDETVSTESSKKQSVKDRKPVPNKDDKDKKRNKAKDKDDRKDKDKDKNKKQRNNKKPHITRNR